ncbi:hypothetical protein [Glycomyces tarimensis]
MPNKRHARKMFRDAQRLASAGDHRTALTGYHRAAHEYRSSLATRDDDTARTELAETLGHIAHANTRLSSHDHAATALAERLHHLTELARPRPELTEAELDLAEAHLRAGHLLSAATRGDNAVRPYDRRDAADPTQPAFAHLAAALARNARILHHAADPDLAVGAADQAARMLLATPGIDTDPERLAYLREVLGLAVELHTAAGRAPFARSAARLLAKFFPEAAPPGPAGGDAPLTLRAALVAAGRLGAFTDANLIDRLCPDPVSHAAPPAISARCDPGLAPVALHAVVGAVEALGSSHSAVAWRMATEIHYLLAAADKQGERNLRLNFRDHGPVWLAMLLSLTDTAAHRPDLAADLARVLAQLLERLRSRHAAEGPLVSAATRFIAAHRPDR